MKNKQYRNASEQQLGNEKRYYKHRIIHTTGHTTVVINRYSPFIESYKYAMNENESSYSIVFHTSPRWSIPSYIINSKINSQETTTKKDENNRCEQLLCETNEQKIRTQ